MATDFIIRQNNLFLPRKPLQTASRQKNRSDSENADAGFISGSGTLRLRLWRLFILLLIASLLLSSLLSGSFADAWGGADGWMMGFLVQALSLFFAFLFSLPFSFLFQYPVPGSMPVNSEHTAFTQEPELRFFSEFPIASGSILFPIWGSITRICRLWEISIGSADICRLSFQFSWGICIWQGWTDNPAGRFM